MVSLWQTAATSLDCNTKEVKLLWQEVVMVLWCATEYLAGGRAALSTRPGGDTTPAKPMANKLQEDELRRTVPAKDTLDW